MARDYGKENREWNSPEKRKKRQGEYMEKHGPQKPRRKRLWPSIGKGKTVKTPRPNFHESFGGGEKAKPHSTKEGRIASGKRKIKRLFSKEATRPRPGRPLPRPSPGWKRPENIMTPLRAKHGVGSIVKKIITKIKPKPPGVFKPKPVPKGVTDKPAGWSPKGSYTKSDDKKITSMLKNLGDEIKAAPLPPQLKKTLKKAQKAFPHGRNKESKKVFKSAKGKAAGGRIGLKHGGSVGAAKRGHGAEIK